MEKGVEKTQIIDYEGNVLEDLKEWMIDNKLNDLGFNYNVIAVLGSQSSGKSTLLNNLFKTSFDVMNTKQGHSQTTKGLWLSYDKFDDENNNSSSFFKLKKKNKPTLILDVEGTDSKERGDNRLTFEHRSALFCLALADCVIVNLWYHSLGNFTASNYGLLKTVMEVNLELFQQEKNSPKTILLFTVRDWFEEFAPIEVVKNKILDEYINKIWKEMKKPKEAEKLNINNYFIIEVVGLSHGIIKKEDFLKDVNNLRDKWINHLRPSKYSRNIPSDGFAHYCNNIWNTIVKQSQLDIPSQKEMLSTFRCQEIKNNVINNISKEIKEKSIESHNKVIENFKEWAEKNIIEKSLEDYFKDASRYKENICLRTSQELLDYLFTQLQAIVDNNLQYIQRTLCTKFFNELSNMYKVCTIEKNTFSFSRDSNLKTIKEHNKNTSNEDVKRDLLNNNQDKCLHLWSNFLYNSDKLEYFTLCNFYENYEKSNIEIRTNMKNYDNIKTDDNIKKDKSIKNDDNNNITTHHFNYKPSLSVLSTSIYKDSNRIRNVQCGILLNKTRQIIKNSFKNMDTYLLTTKNTEEYWNNTVQLVLNLQDSIHINLTKCFINLKGSNDKNSNIYDDDDDDMMYNNDEDDANLSKNDESHNNKFSFSLTNVKGSFQNINNNNEVNDEICYTNALKKIDIIKNNQVYKSTINEEINNKLQNKIFVNELKNYYLDEIMDALKSKLDEISENLANIIIQRFESVFNYDEYEQPRQWRDISMVELKKIFLNSKNYAFLIIDILQKNIKVELIDDYLPNNFIKDEIIEKGKIKAKRKIQEICRDAQYIQETGAKMSLKNIPVVFWIILLLFGWNEILFFIRMFFKLNVILPLFFAVAFIVSTFVYNGNTQALSYINKIIFYMAKNSYNFYKHIQAISNPPPKNVQKEE
ncbi:root hair defective 3 GTP-binding protein (RHD3) homolog, putative [Plasmodium sp. gorilla clade G2]|uniref:root hair defective 3 GTP-binding protein (RHD3) homolog, putative n=1 Tax=Plasmodium sp. gorilla clade G2 TaxID=880535 RepID=UPI000D212427|nr:root hair defective 3 GTP-binding protein (RHD3) homolog, putative [Plasmodium sp. gorilla clade G2]SOV18844.1 root hair defective 3 GTP-binding protein (RHD3) homolog, putative [Plasmodium sp. gorilla clade G2]